MAEAGIVFLYAPAHHPAMRYAAAVRREIGIRTVFNILGPLSNPAGAKIQLLGVYSEELTETLARSLLALGSERAWVVHGGDGLDEITLAGPTVVSELRGGAVRTFHLDPAEHGLKVCRPEELKGGDAGENGRIILEILEGGRGPRADAAALNAAAAILLSGIAADLGEGLARAREAVSSGRAMQKLQDLRRLTR